MTNEMMTMEQLEGIAGGNRGFEDMEKSITVEDYHTARPTPLPYVEPITIPKEQISIPIPKPDPEFQKPIDIKFFKKYL